MLRRLSQFSLPLKFSLLVLYYTACSAQRTHVLDDERDFFNVDATSWKSPQEKAALVQREEELREKKFGSHRNRAVTLDIAGRRVVEEHSEIGGGPSVYPRLCISMYYWRVNAFRRLPI